MVKPLVIQPYTSYELTIVIASSYMLHLVLLYNLHAESVKMSLIHKTAHSLVCTDIVAKLSE